MKVWPVAVACILVEFAIVGALFGAAVLSAPCPTEDSVSCTWYADTQGVPGGTSFTDIGGRVTLWWGDR